MRRRKAAVVGAALVLGAGALASACRAPTQITVVVTAPDDSVCQGQLQTAISLGTTDSFERRVASSTATGCASHRVGSLVVIPTGDESEDVAVRVVGSLDGAPCDPPAYGPSCIVARRALHFIPNESLTVVVRLGAECENVPCSSTTTCVNRACVGATIGDPGQCAGSAGCGDGVLGPGTGTGTDAGAGGSDAGVDATVSDGAVADTGTGADARDAGAGASEAGTGGEAGVALGVGDQFACVKRANGTVACWGQNPDGELGFVSPDGGSELLPRDVPALGSPVALSGGAGFGCELLPGGVVKCWGDNGDGIFGLPADAGVQPPTTVATGSSGICAGAYASCTIDANGGGVRCWSGDTDDGLAVPGIANAAQLACGAQVACARLADGTVRCWGSSTEGALGVPGAVDTRSAVQPAVTGVVDLAMYARHACAALTDGTVRCWGQNGDLQSDPSYDAGLDADIPAVEAPKVVTGVSGATRVAVGYFHSCALLGDGGVTCWGSNSGLQLGKAGACGLGCAPTPVAGLPRAVQITAALNDTCVVIDDGGVWCWGTNYTGELGRGTISGGELPGPVHL